MSKRGPKPRAGDRYPGGKLKPFGEPISPVVIQRLFRDGTKLGIDSRLASQVGRLWCLREFNGTHAAVAFRIAGIYARFEAAHGLHRKAKSAAYEMGLGGGHSDDEDSFLNENLTELEQLIPHRMRAAVEQLCVEDCAISSLALPAVRNLFETIADVWGMRGKSKKGSPAKGAHIPLHFHAHDKKPDPVSAEQRRPNVDRLYWIETMKRLRPDMADKDLGAEYDRTLALKQRHIFREEKERLNGRGNSRVA